MVEFLSPAWLDALDEAGRATGAPPDVRLVVQHVAVQDDGSERAYAVRIADGTVRVEPGRVPDADLTLTMARATAGAIAQGELPAAAAFLAGDLRVGGDPARVLDAARLLADLPDVFGPVRAETSW